MKRIGLVCLVVLSAWGLAPVVAQDGVIAAETAPTVAAEAPAPPPPVVLELFTSQGCPFCPPADALLGQLAQSEGVIGLACHVDYFNLREGSLGKSFCTERQLDYNRLIGTGPRYTPEMVINGKIDVIGYEAGKISAAILKARSERITTITLTAAEGGGYIVSVPETDIGVAKARLWYAVYDAPRDVTIAEGSNSGRQVRYFNVVSRIEDLGAWDGAALTEPVAPDWRETDEGIAVIAQDSVTGHIIAAGSAKRAAPSPLLQAPGSSMR